MIHVERHQCWQHRNAERTHNRRSRKYAVRKLAHIISVPNSREDWDAAVLIAQALRQVRFETFTEAELERRFVERCAEEVA